jgi:chromosome segregation ATPase
MARDSNAEYMAILGALGAVIENNKTDLALAKYDIERLQAKLEEAHKEIAELNALLPIPANEPVEKSDYPFNE